MAGGRGTGLIGSIRNNAIASADIFAVGTLATSSRYFADDKPWFEVNNILRLRTEDGLEAVSGVDSGDQERFNDRHLIELQVALQTL